MNKNPEIQFRSPEEIKAYQESRLAEETALFAESFTILPTSVPSTSHRYTTDKNHRRLATNTCHDQDRPATS